MIAEVEKVLSSGASVFRALRCYCLPDLKTKERNNAPESVSEFEPVIDIATNALQTGSTLETFHVNALQASIFKNIDCSSIRLAIEQPDALAEVKLTQIIRTAVDGYQVACSHTYLKLSPDAYRYYLPIRKLAELVIRKFSSNSKFHSRLAAASKVMREYERAFDPFSDDSSFQIAQRRSYQLTADLIDALLVENHPLDPC